MGLFDGSIGAFVVGTLLSTFLLGVTATQAFNYYKLFPNDRRVYWWMVTGMLILDWVHTALSCFTIYDWTVTFYGDPTHLVNSPFSFAVDPAMTGIAASVVQLFYAYRVYVVGKRRLFLPIMIAFFSLVQLGFACGATGMIFKLQAFSKFQSWTYGVSIWLGSAAVCDVLITGSLVYALINSKTGILQTNSICDRLIELVIQSNGLTAACAIVDAVLFGTLSTSYHVTVNLCLVKLYFNSLLVSLNARAELEKHLMGPRTSGNSPTLVTASGFGASDLHGFPFAGLPIAKVYVSTTQHVVSERCEDVNYEKHLPHIPKRTSSAVVKPVKRMESEGSLESDATTM
ncbi:hypothetical protein MNV49_004929 [Pseudohyphozyma bogoriensis]|nr:hypothetical protein MNV49_004929 [Pseudohyphozyma bogoriensis]